MAPESLWVVVLSFFIRTIPSPNDLPPVWVVWEIDFTLLRNYLGKWRWENLGDNSNNR